MIEALGQGTWGIVHKAEQKETGRIVAIKKIKSERPDEGINFTAVREIKLLREFKHENIIELVDCFTTRDQAICLVYECAHTDLEKILGNRAIPISLADIKQHLWSLLKAISACHERWILHRDLKPGTIEREYSATWHDVTVVCFLQATLVNLNQHATTFLVADNLLFLADGTMKLADFGLARMYGTPKTRLSPQAITLW